MKKINLILTAMFVLVGILAAIGALTYFDVFDLSLEKTQFSNPILNADIAEIKGNEQQIEIAFINGAENTIDTTLIGNITNLEIGGVGTDCTSVAVTNSTSGVLSRGRFILTWTCTGGNAWTVGETFKADLSFDYTNQYTTQTKTHGGSVSGRIS